MASDLRIERNDSKWEIRDSPAKKQRCEGYTSPPSPPSPSPLCSSAEEEKEDPRSKIVFYNYDDDSDVEDDSDGMHEFTDKEFQEYDRQLTQSDGFDVMYFPRSFGFGGTEPVFNLDEIADDLKTFSELALKQYNDKEFKKLEFVKVVKANVGLCAGFKYYITFDVKDADAVDGGTMEFEACVWDGIGHTDVLISRLKISTYCVVEDFTKDVQTGLNSKLNCQKSIGKHSYHQAVYYFLIPILLCLEVFGALGGLREESYGTGARGILVNLLEFTCLVAYHHIPQLMPWWPIILTSTFLWKKCLLHPNSCNGHSKNHEFIYKYNLPFHSFGIEIISASLLCTKFFSPREYRTTLVCQTRKLKCCFCEILNCCIMGDGYLFKLVRIAVRGKFRLKHIVSTTKLDHHLLDFEFP
ncbi:unnamed protein product [Camellia sinensis]